ncbi:TraR/DksA C4-type zinc finger protein [Candidatus Gribaldobacteria bacterium]|nr:TraR/DksA C4-type zinc finger protein [Candidatus Gribaldobacteria bacterium]
MDKKFLEKQKERLLENKEELEKKLSSFAREADSRNDWTAEMPSFDPGTSLEEEADEVEEFGMRLALERTLENELKKVDFALDKIKKNKYGVCDKCQKTIPKGRLEAYPQAEFCAKCQ